MASTVWKGSLTFGLVSIPVKLTRAARAERIRFRQLYRPQPALRAMPRRAPEPIEEAEDEEDVFEAPVPLSVSPVRQTFVTEAAEEPVRRSDIVKGFEYEPDRYVVVEQHELRDLEPPTSREMEISEFVKLEEIDPVYFETSYYVAPDRGGELGYAILFDAMKHTAHVAVARLTMHRREHVVIIRPGRTGLLLHTMFYAAEVRQSDEYRTDTSLVGTKQRDLASAFVDALAEPFDPQKYKDTWREKVEALIAGKTGIAHAPEAKPKGRVVDIMAALRESLARVKKAPAREEKARKRTTRKNAKTG